MVAPLAATILAEARGEGCEAVATARDGNDEKVWGGNYELFLLHVTLSVDIVSSSSFCWDQPRVVFLQICVVLTQVAVLLTQSFGLSNQPTVTWRSGVSEVRCGAPGPR